MPVIDIHTHVFPDDVARAAMPTMEENAGVRAAFDGTIGGLRASMRVSGIDVSVLQPVATRPSQVRSINDWVASCVAEDIVAFGSIHPDFDDSASELARLRSLGMRGVKLHPEFQACSPTDERMKPIYEAVLANDLIVLFHAGLDIAIDTLRGTPSALADVARTYPGMRMILAHMGGFRLWDDVERHIIGLPVYLDTSYSLGHMPPERFIELVRAHGTDRVLFGTDAPWANQALEVAAVRGLGLPDEDLALIMWRNAERLLGLPTLV